MPPTDAGPSHASAPPERRPHDRPTSIRRTVWLASTSMLVLVCVLVGLSLWLQAWTERHHRGMDRLHEQQHAELHLKELVTATSEQLLLSLAFDAPLDEATTMASRETLRDAHERLLDTIDDDRSVSQVTSLVDALGTDIRDQVVLHRTASLDEARDHYDRRLGPHLDRLHELIDLSLDDLDSAIDGATVELHQSRRTSIVAIAIAAALLAVVATIAIRRLYRRIVGPLLDLQETVVAIEQGRRERARPMRSVEFDTLARSLNRMADRVQERESHLRAIIESEPECVKTITPDCRIIDINPAGLTAIEADSIDEVRGTPVLDLVHPDHREAYRAMHERVIAGASETLTFEVIGLRGGHRWVETHAVPLHDADGAVTAHLAVSRDVTERRRHEQEMHAARDAAEAASRSKSAFLANMSHEIRTPMAAILGFADLLDTADATDEHRRECTETIRRNGLHLLAIINDILDLSKIEAGRLEIEQIPVSVHAVIADVLELMTVRAASKALDLDVVWRGAIPRTIRTDPVRLRQILVNLVGNAIKFTEVGGVRVGVGVSHPETGDPALVIDVVDSGIGLADDVLHSLFEPFSQGDSSMTRRFGGTGLGLQISRKLASMLGGSIDVKSTPGQGSHFTLTIDAGPLDDVAPESSEVLAAPPEHPEPLFVPPDAADANPPLEGVRILVAEDGLDNQRLIGFVLRRAGATVRIVDNGRLAVTAVTAATAERFDLILMDMQMPELDGYGATRELRELGCRTPIVALTAHAMAGDRERCLAAGCSDYASKPIDRETLIELCCTWTAAPAIDGQ